MVNLFLNISIDNLQYSNLNKELLHIINNLFNPISCKKYIMVDNNSFTLVDGNEDDEEKKKK